MDGGEGGGGFHVNTRRQGTWADSELERTLKILLHSCRAWHADRELLEAGQLHLRVFESLKKEFRCLRQVWLMLRELVSAIDELNMATLRLRLRLEEEPKTDPPQPNILEKSEVR